MPTITGNIKHPSLDASTSVLSFERITAPGVVGSSVITGRDVVATPDETGDFSVELAEGSYRFYPNRDDERFLLIDVGDDNADVVDLVTSEITEGTTSFRMKNYDTGAWVTVRIRDAGGTSTVELV